MKSVLDYGIGLDLAQCRLGLLDRVWPVVDQRGDLGEATREQHSKAKVDVEPREEPWSQEELLWFRAVADGHEWAAAWRLTLCGLRRSEVMGMRWDAVDLDRGEVTIKAGRVSLDGGQRTATDDPKSSASRRIVPAEGVPQGTTALLKALRARQAADKLKHGAAYTDTGYVLVNELGKPVRPEFYSDTFRKLCAEAGLRTIHLHLVRHTLAGELIKAGASITDAAALLGHTPDVFVATYLRKTEAGPRSAASALGAALGGMS